MAEQDQSQDTHGYYDWQMNTLLLAYDVVDPMPRGNEAAMNERREKVEHELREMALRILPDAYHTDPTLDVTPELMMAFTKETLARANEIANG